MVKINNKICINLQIKDCQNILKYASIWNIEHAHPLIKQSDMYVLNEYLLTYLNDNLEFKLFKKEVLSNGKSNIYLNIKGISKQKEK